MLFLYGSPRKNGVTDRLAGLIAASIPDRQDIFLRDYAIAPCAGCQICLLDGGKCVLPADDAAPLFAAMRQAEALFIAAPIYFYALPGHMKIFIDRSQKFWAHDDMPRTPRKKAFVLLAAGRPRGRKLFAGSLLTLKWFLLPFGYRIAEPLLLRGLDAPADIGQELEAQMRAFGRRLRDGFL